jgi:hypothetical protein
MQKSEWRMKNILYFWNVHERDILLHLLVPLYDLPSNLPALWDNVCHKKELNLILKKVNSNTMHTQTIQKC